MVRTALLAFAGCVAFAQAVPDVEFDAASVKLATSYPKDGKFTVGSRNDPGRYAADYVHMRDLIAEAYSVQ